MARYPEEIIENVRAANDIVDVVSQYVHLKKSGANYFGLCPFHNEKTASFSVNRDKQIFHCFGCGAGGTVFTFIQKYENCTYPEAVRAMAERAGIALPEQELSAEERRAADERGRIMEIQKEAARYFYRMLRSGEGSHAHRYFTERGLSADTMKRFGLGYSPKRPGALYAHLKGLGYSDEELRKSGLVVMDEKRGARDKFWNRAMFPIMDPMSRVIAFGGRVMGEGQPKYLNSPETMVFNKSRTLYGLQLAKRTRGKWILCEGYMDVIALHQAGFDGAVASLGTSLTEGHAGILKRYTDHVFLSYDSDGAGKKAALRAIPILKSAGITAKVISLSPYKDPDELIKAEGAESFAKRIGEAKNAFLFSVDMAASEYDLSDPEGKTAFAKECARRILELPEQVERDNYIDAVCRAYGIAVDSMRALVRNTAASGIRPERTDVKSAPARRHDVRKKEGEYAGQKLLLSWICSYPDLYHKGLSDHIDEEDFSEGVFRRVAALVFGAIDKGEPVDAARLLGTFTDENEMAAAAGILSAREAGVESEEEIIKALPEVCMKVKRHALEEKMEKLDPADAAGYQRIIEERKKLSELVVRLNHF